MQYDVIVLVYLVGVCAAAVVLVLSLLLSCIIKYLASALSNAAWYILATMSTAGIALSTTICILNIYHYNPSMPVPAWLDRLVIKILARAIRMHLSDATSSGLGSVHPSDDVIVEDMTKEKGGDVIMEQQRYPLMPPDVQKYVRSLIRKEKEHDRLQNNREQWVRVGKIVDRFLFYVLFVVMLVTAVILFSVLASRG